MNNVITLGKTKGKKVRLLPMNAVVVDTLLKLRAGSRDEFVFPIDQSEGDVRSKFKYHWGELCKKVGLSGFRFHDLRATFATRLDARGVGAFTIKRYSDTARWKLPSGISAWMNPAGARSILWQVDKYVDKIP